METATSPQGSGMASPKIPSCFICSMSASGRCWRAQARGRPAAPRVRRTGRTVSTIACSSSFSSFIALQSQPTTYRGRARAAPRPHAPTSNSMSRGRGLGRSRRAWQRDRRRSGGLLRRARGEPLARREQRAVGDLHLGGELAGEQVGPARLEVDLDHLHDLPCLLPPYRGVGEAVESLVGVEERRGGQRTRC